MHFLEDVRSQFQEEPKYSWNAPLKMHDSPKDCHAVLNYVSKE